LGGIQLKRDKGLLGLMPQQHDALLSAFERAHHVFAYQQKRRLGLRLHELGAYRFAKRNPAV
jgi:hypothetical protein